MLKSLICAVSDAGLSQTFFWGFHAISFIFGCFVAMWYGKKMGFGVWKGTPLVVIGFSLTYIWMLTMHWIFSGFQTFGGQNHVMTFIYQPLIYALPSKILKIEWKKCCSALAVGTPLVQGIGHIGCIFAGCCEGYPSSWGIYNARTQMYHFPNQLIEAIVAISIAIFIMHLIKKNNYKPDTTHYPIMLILYGSTRFLLEFLRSNEKLILWCSALAFHALFMCLVGIVALIVIKKKRKIASQVV